MDSPESPFTEWRLIQVMSVENSLVGVAERSFRNRIKWPIHLVVVVVKNLPFAPRTIVQVSERVSCRGSQVQPN